MQVETILDQAFQKYRDVEHECSQSGLNMGVKLSEAATRYCVATRLMAEDSMFATIEAELALIDQLLELCQSEEAGNQVNASNIPDCLMPYCQSIFGNLTPKATPSASTTPKPPAQLALASAKSEPTATHCSVPSELDADSWQMFLSEVTDHLNNIEPNLLELENNPDDKEALNTVFRSFHTIKGNAGFLDLKDIIHVTHEAETLLDLARDNKIRVVSSSMDVILRTVDVIRDLMQRYGTWVADGTIPLRHPQQDQLISQLKRLAAGEILGTDEIVTKNDQTEEEHALSNNVETLPISGNAPAQATTPASANKNKPAAAAESVKVDKDRLDELIDLIGELVIAESMVSSVVHTLDVNNSVNARKFSQLRKITRELQELSLSLRMVPINGLFQRMARLVRDLSRKLGKDIDCEIIGGETDLDKNIIEQVADPLIHIVRNSLDHGIEPTKEERRANGKPERAKITLRAFYRGGNIYIEIEDDGRGLNRERILQKAISQGVISSAEGMTENEINSLIFAPGFSTAAEVTDLSGRGVGMDVVRRNIDALHGSVEIRSKQGHGTTVSLRLPLTLAIIDGMVVRVNQQRYIIPTLSILQQIRPMEKDLATIQGQGELMAVRGKNISFFRLSELFDHGTPRISPTKGTIVLVEIKDKVVGFFVDEIIGQQQVVIKHLGHGMDSLPGVSGGAVLPDGQVGVILDVHGLLQLAKTKDLPIVAA